MSKTAASYPQTGRAQTLRLVKMSSMVAISIVLVYLIHFPIFPAVAFLEYDPADISILSILCQDSSIDTPCLRCVVIT